jgi:uncharacterized protein (TIGR04141 family)
VRKKRKIKKKFSIDKHFYLVNKDDVDRNKFEVVYCIITNIPNNQWPAKVPFFSKISLHKEKRAIEKLGFRVLLTRVPPGR